LALFALPKLGDDDEEPDKRNEEQKTISTRSSSYSEASNDSRPPKTLAELSKPIEGTDEDGDEAEETSLSELEFKFALLNKDTTERQDSENKESISEDNWIVDELDNVKLGVGYLDSREEPTPPPPARVSIINNRIYNQSDSDSEEEHKRGSRRRFPSRTPSKYSRERDYGERDAWALQHARQEFERELDQERLIRDREQQAAQRQYELKRTQKELEELKLVAKIDEEEKRRGRTAKEEYELREAKKELDAIREQKERDELERRIKQKMELERLKQEEAALAEKKRREKEAKEVVERYKKKEEGKEKEKEVYRAPINDKPRPTYTRMARRHLSLETLRVCGIDYIIDQVSNIPCHTCARNPEGRDALANRKI
jgi:hypothetical protein